MRKLTDALRLSARRRWREGREQVAYAFDFNGSGFDGFRVVELLFGKKFRVGA